MNYDTFDEDKILETNKYLKKIKSYSWKYFCLVLGLSAASFLSIILVAGALLSFPKNNLEKINWYKNFLNYTGVSTALLVATTAFSCWRSNKKVNNFANQQIKEAYQELFFLLEKNNFLETCKNYSNAIECLLSRI